MAWVPTGLNTQPRLNALGGKKSVREFTTESRDDEAMQRGRQTSFPAPRSRDPMDLGLRDKVAAVAAASQGLGKAVAEEFVPEGAKVANCAPRADDPRATHGDNPRFT